VPYTPDCAKTGFDMCVHPAFGAYLDDVAAALDPVAAEIAGLPGAPVRAEQVPNGAPFYGGRIIGAPPVYEFTVTITWVSPAVAGLLVQQGLLYDFIGGPAYQGSGNLGPAQQAVLSALLTGPPACRPRRVDRRVRGVRGRPAPVHRPRPSDPTRRPRLSGTASYCGGPRSRPILGAPPGRGGSERWLAGRGRPRER
jgi:hypothetical protein